MTPTKPEDALVERLRKYGHHEAADAITTLLERERGLVEALGELLDTVDGQPLPDPDAQIDRLERAIWFAVCALREASGETYNVDGGNVADALVKVMHEVREARAALTGEEGIDANAENVEVREV